MPWCQKSHLQDNDKNYRDRLSKFFKKGAIKGIVWKIGEKTIISI